ncbi:SCL-interrupting locus protein homolog [Littorina saxatilis]|uniref:Uncharacterized protein n=1 Tax=Littorina saxatilis TaxID=31220 RepID=A0AAN9B8E1_9CAEN
MAVPLRVRNIPEYLRAPQFADHYEIPSRTRQNEPDELLQFPKSTCVLWDGTSTGPPTFLHVAQNRKPRLQVGEQVLWLIHKQTENEGTANKILVGSLSVEDDAEGVCFHIDGLDTRQTDSNSSLALGDVMIPVQVSNSRNQDRTGSADDYIGAIKMLQKRCRGRDPFDLNSLLLVKGWCSFYSHQNAEKTVAHLQFDVVTLATVFKATPVNPVPIVPTALAKNLGGPRSLSQMQGRPKIGYLTMDHTRKLLLVLESDPKVSSLPIVGIWVSGVPVVHHPFVWAACLRYLHNGQLQDRVCTPPEGFLLVMYTPHHSKPEFYEVSTTSGKPDLEFDLYTGYEITSLNKKSSGPDPSVIDWELSPVRNGPKRELFDAALEGLKFAKDDGQKSSRDSASPALSTSEDIMPRMTPAPYSAMAMSVKPMVPEVSMFWNDSSPSPGFGPTPFPSAPNQMPCPYSAATSASYPSAPAPIPAQRFGAGGPVPSTMTRSVPSSMNGYPAARDVSAGSNFNNCYTSSGGQQSESMPRGALGYHQNLRTAQNQNNNARVPNPSASVPSSGFQSAACRTSAPQPYNPSSQPGKQFSSASYPQPQGYTSAAMNQGAPSQPRMMFCSVAQENYQPHSQPPQPQPQPFQFPQPQQSHYPQPQSSQFFQPQPSQYPQSQPYQHSQTPQPYSQPPQPRLMPAVSMNFCRPNQPAPGFQARNPVPNSSQGVGQPQQPGPSQVDSQPRPRFAPSSQSQARQTMPWPNQMSMQGGPVSVPNSSVCPQGRPYSPQDSNPQPQTKNSRPEETNYNFQKQCENTSGESNPQSFQNMSDPSRGHRLAQQNTANQQPFTSYAQPPSGNQGEIYAQGQPVHPSQTCVNVSQPVVTHHAGLVMQVGNVGDSTHADSTSCSGKSSDDSGLSITPDHSDPLTKSASFPGEGVEGATGGSLQGVNWAGVPPEVVQLLVQQDAQLKVLTSQIQQLLSQQASSPASSAATTPNPSSANSTPATLTKETCSTAVNTTFLDQELPWGRPHPGQCASVQTSPQASPHLHRTHPQSPLAHSSHDSPLPVSSRDSPQRRGSPPCQDNTAERHQQRMNASHAATEGNFIASYRDDAGSAGQTPSEIRHQGVVQLSSTQREGVAMTAAGSFHSNVSLEQASPARCVESRSQTPQSAPSPQSASMCGLSSQGEEENTGGDVSPDSKEYYDQLISNIRVFLNSHSQEADHTDANPMDTFADDPTCSRLQLMDSNFAASPALPACHSTGGGSSSNTTMMPHINYLSLMLTETDTSMEMNAMAMKYLRDEQLTHLARIHQSPQVKAGATNNHLWRQVLAASLDATGSSDVSRLGVSATNMSMATRTYMEKHGLLGGGDGESMLDSNHTLCLQTDFSMAMISQHAGSHSIPTSPQKGGTNPQHNPRSPLKREILHQAFSRSPAIREEAENSYEERSGRGFEDMGASPALQPQVARRYQYRDPSPEDTPMFPERYHGAPGQNLLNDCSVDTEDDRILDIEKLKQMPKLL